VEWLIAVLVSAAAMFFALWRTSARKTKAFEQQASALEVIAAQASDVAKSLSESVSKQEEELKKVDEAHKVLRAELAETTKAIAAAKLQDGSLATAWDQTTGEE
jgi:phage/plasmid primase-like uncharacterized protein